MARNAKGAQFTPAQRAAWGHKRDISRAAELNADTSDSTCFDVLSYRDGIVTAIFTDGSEYQYDGFTLADAEDWFDDDSLGGYFNSEIREPTPKGN